MTDLKRVNMTYFPHFPRVQQALLEPAADAGRGHSVVLGGAGDRGSEPLLHLRHLQRVRQLLSRAVFFADQNPSAVLPII